MIFVRSNLPSRNAHWLVFLIVAVQTISSTGLAALPTRLVLFVDGVSYRDMKALQEGIPDKDGKGRAFHRQAFHQNYFPVSRLVSTFPSVSDPAWTEILGNRPTPGYQRTYFSATEGSVVFNNGVTSSAEYERQMTWQMDGGFRRVMSYVFPLNAFKYEVNALVENFLNTSDVTNYYALIHSTDVAQHLSGDISAMLCALDAKLRELRDIYRAREGRDLEILILSDHGNNRAGGGKRVAIKGYLKKAGYRIAKSIKNPKDIVLPTAGIESWIEIHNSPMETERLVQLLSRLEGVDVLTARSPNQTNQFIIMSSRGERAVIDWNDAKNSFRYSTESGDPIDYRSVIDALARKNKLDSDGFATADDWMAETLTHRYPVALERIVRGHTQAALNPANILVSLDNDFVHCEWLIRRGAVLVASGGTHGGLDDINSNGILLSSFAPTEDTSTSRVAAMFGGFKGLRDYRAEESGAEWDLQNESGQTLSAKELCLQMWTPTFARVGFNVPVEITIEKASQFSPAQIRRTDPKPIKVSGQTVMLQSPLPFPDRRSYERTYPLPATLIFEPERLYRISGRIRDGEKSSRIFNFTFRTDSRGLPMSGIASSR